MDVRLGPTQIPVISIVGGKSNSGKTTLLEKLIREAKGRGWRVATLKHDVHGFEMDQPGKDTWRHDRAGADIVAISSPQRIAVLERVSEDQPLDEVLARIHGVDIIFTEGYKHADKPKIEVFRSAVHEGLFSKPEELIAIASDLEFDNGIPCFSLEDVQGICDLIEDKFGVQGNK
ncbi:molybdopterin-guanine dinucleotide biosynthesis protein B [Desulfosporosinus sp.]|uniref:molybdopterin-guanine dinucleotide biosynthesis protein B n=1 Tax=Desulfosporosinus sp. TaxID=157907 RepID=UPI000E933FAD|nr:molybdopterin-guanine dinucleotide biosynthesis protein B [Desulfosporosinus sp.]MBC2721414.1 molybdopterin-guanine dinucleotide biosynthesis protein B [Desulfosporosinus sp.]MBC2728897.1 molybdopterin-guanine dinucleotide biosynthesis protein B [Desulfosporosinus sp.]HBV85972.1 molybdopterin-guanine dinucleotide biosynthesis protein B [Desulfosporosinus sp.]